MNKKFRKIVNPDGFFRGYKKVIKEKFDPRINEALKKYMSEDRDQVISECSRRAADLESHAKMWGHAGGVGGSMAMNAWEEVRYLKGIVADLENGTTEHLAHLFDKKIEYLEFIKSEAGLVNAAHILYINNVIKETLKQKEESIIELENRKKMSK